MRTRLMLLILLTPVAMLISSTPAKAHLIEKTEGRGWAQFVARGIEYNWRPTSGYARTSLEDMKLSDSSYAAILPLEAPVSLLGEPEAWEEQWSVPLPAGVTPKDVLKSISDIWAAEKNWTGLKEDRVDGSDMSVWKFKDQMGKSWIATASVESSASRNGQALVTLRIVRASSMCELFGERQVKL